MKIALFVAGIWVQSRDPGKSRDPAGAWLCDVALYGLVFNSMIWYGPLGSIWYGVVLYSSVCYGPVWYGRVFYGWCRAAEVVLSCHPEWENME